MPVNSITVNTQSLSVQDFQRQAEGGKVQVGSKAKLEDIAKSSRELVHKNHSSMSMIRSGTSKELNRETIKLFVEAVRHEQGDVAALKAARLLQSHCDQGKPLTASVIRHTLAEIETVMHFVRLREAAQKTEAAQKIETQTPSSQSQLATPQVANNEPQPVKVQQTQPQKVDTQKAAAQDFFDGLLARTDKLGVPKETLEKLFKEYEGQPLTVATRAEIYDTIQAFQNSLKDVAPAKTEEPGLSTQQDEVKPEEITQKDGQPDSTTNEQSVADASKQDEQPGVDTSKKDEQLGADTSKKDEQLGADTPKKPGEQPQNTEESVVLPQTPPQTDVVPAQPESVNTKQAAQKEQSGDTGDQSTTDTPKKHGEQPQNTEDPASPPKVTPQPEVTVSQPANEPVVSLDENQDKVTKVAKRISERLETVMQGTPKETESETVTAQKDSVKKLLGKKFQTFVSFLKDVVSSFTSKKEPAPSVVASQTPTSSVGGTQTTSEAVYNSVMQEAQRAGREEIATEILDAFKEQGKRFTLTDMLFLNTLYSNLSDIEDDESLNTQTRPEKKDWAVQVVKEFLLSGQGFTVDLLSAVNAKIHAFSPKTVTPPAQDGVPTTATQPTTSPQVGMPKPPPLLLPPDWQPPASSTQRVNTRAEIRAKMDAQLTEKHEAAKKSILQQAQKLGLESLAQEFIDAFTARSAPKKDTFLQERHVKFMTMALDHIVMSKKEGDDEDHAKIIGIFKKHFPTASITSAIFEEKQYLEA